MREIRPQMESGNWYIVEFLGWLSPTGKTGDAAKSDPRSRENLMFWNGDRWWGQRASGVVFSSQEEAESFIQANRQQLEDAL